MTGCAWMSPDDILSPALLSDTVISIGPLSSIGPARVINHDVSKTGSIHLARKSYILNDKCVVAFSGNAKTIADFLVHAKNVVDFNEKSERPMRALCELADQYTAGSISVIGGYLTDYGINSIAPIPAQEKIDGFGLVATVGTGASALSKMIKKMIPEMRAEGHGLDWLAYDTALAIGQTRLQQELYNQIDDQTWGGFFETLYVDWNQKNGFAR